MSAQISPAKTSSATGLLLARQHWQNGLLLLLVLGAFLRVTWSLGAEDLWWDESLTLQRAESSLLPLLRNEILLTDGISQVVSTDQHPFFYFLIQGLLLRLAGDEEYALRFVSVMASTMMVPAAYVFSRLYVRRGVFTRGSPGWAALLAAVSPFFLWFGQEARPYALWALLALLSTYTLLRASSPSESNSVRWPWVVLYAATLAMFLTTHYYAVLLLPVHAVLIYRAISIRHRALAAILGLFVLAVGIAIVAIAYWYVIVQQGAGDNFSHISWKIMLPDLLNAFSLGLSADISRVLWVDLIFGALALAAAIWSLRSRLAWVADGWVPAAMVAVPVAAVLIGDQVQPMYMTARHLSLIGGPFIVLVGAGLGLIWAVRPWLSILTALILVTASGFSTINYFTQEIYAQDDFSRLASDLDDRLAPGDLVLIKSPFAWRIFSYYQPKVSMNGTALQADQPEALTVYGVPLLERTWKERFDFLEDVTDGPRRIWLLVSGTQAHMDLDEQVEAWLDEHLYKLLETPYFSQSSLKSHLYLPEVPVYEAIPASMQNRVDVTFGDKVVLHGYSAGFPPDSNLALPLTLYWEAAAPMDRRYKYQVRLVEQMDDGTHREISTVEQEPYRGVTPTIYWDPGKIIVEYTELPLADSANGRWPTIVSSQDAGRFRLLAQVYDAETLEKLPVTAGGDYPILDDGATVVLPYRPQLDAP